MDETTPNPFDTPSVPRPPAPMPGAVVAPPASTGVGSTPPHPAAPARPHGRDSSPASWDDPSALRPSDFFDPPAAPPTSTDFPRVIEQPPAPKAPRTFGVRQLVTTAVLSAVVAAGVSIPVARSTARDAAPTSVAGAPITFDPGTSLVSAIAGQVSGSVVRIDATSGRGEAIGSGVIYRADGYVLTNAHVVAGGTQFTVTLPDGNPIDAELVGSDASTDVAVLKVDATGLPVIALAEGLPVVGETAIAIGSPFGLDGSVTAGIVSALNRQITTQGGVLVDAIQTDAAINSGNSGGALVNGRGELMGINTAILTNTGDNAGIGFAIPISTARNVADQLIGSGTVEHAYLGIRGQTIDPTIAAQYNIGTDKGVVIVDVDAATPAEAGGLLARDLIVGLDDEAIDSMADLLSALQRRKAGDVITLDIIRGGEHQTLTITLGSRTN